MAAALLFSSGLVMLAPAAGAQETAAVPFTPLASVYQEDFELGDGGWTAGGVASTWQFGTPAAVGGPAGAVSGLNAWGTNLVGDYTNSTCSWVRTPAIELPAVGADMGGAGVSAARLAFRHWLNTENAWDGAVVQVSKDGGESWATVAPPGGYPVLLQSSASKCVAGATSPRLHGWSGPMSANADAWLEAEADLTGYLGETIQVRFLLASDSIISRRGWYLDDVVVQVGAGAVARATPPALDVSAFQPVTTLYAEDFELGQGDWSAGGVASSWQFGTPSVVGPSSPHSGVNVWGTNLAGSYNPSECSWLMSPPIALPGAGAAMPDGTSAEVARLHFMQWFNAENRYDGGLVQVSTNDGASWTTLQIDPAYNNVSVHAGTRGCLGLSMTDVFQTNVLSARADEWLSVSADLTPFLGETIRVRFAFGSDPSVHRPGWYIDDVAVVAGVGASVGGALPPVDDLSSVPFTPLLTPYAEGFEDGLNGWTLQQHKVDTRVYADSWARGVPASFSGGPLPSSGAVLATNPGGFYLNNTCSAITSPAFDLSGVAAGSPVSLSYRYWYRSESGWDAAIVEVSSDGGATWAKPMPTPNYPTTTLQTAARQCLGNTFSTTAPVPAIRAYTGNLSTTSSSWITGTVDLSAYAGSEVLVRYRFASDPSVVVGGGMYVDNVTVTANGATLHFFDFESGTQGWTSAPTPIAKPMTWRVGAPTAGPSAAAEGANVLATNPNGNYADGECTAAVSPVLDLSGVPEGLAARLSLKQWFAAGTGDAGLVQRSVDGGAWETIAPSNGYTSATLSTTARACFDVPSTARGYTGALNSANWTDVSLDLSDVVGSTVQVRFFLGADNATNAVGWYLDDVKLEIGLPAMSVALGELSAAGIQVDPRLAVALGGQGEHGDAKFLDIVIGGPALVTPPTTVEDRVGLMAFYEAQSAAWIADVTRYVIENDGEVLAAFAAAPAVVARLPADVVAGLRHVEGVERLTLDDEQSVHLIAPVPCDCDAGGEDDLSAQNAQAVPLTQAPEIWALGYRGEGMKISIIDTGLDGTHEALKDASCNSRIVAWKDFVGTSTTPYDDNGHGTHVAGTAAGSKACGGRDDGVAPNAQIMGAKFLSASGGGTFQAAMDALQWSFDNGADVTSNSWGASSCTASLDVLRLVNNLAKAGMVSAFAAGNSGPSSGTIGGPGCADYVVTVGSTDKSMVVSGFSSRGPCADPTEGGVSRICPDIMAVGSGVVSSVPRGSCSLCNPTGYRMANGTSMATPAIGGALALMEQFKRDLTGSGWDTANKAEETALKLTALDLGVPGEDNLYGAGFVQLLPIYNILANPGVPDVRESFSAPASDLRVGNSGTLSFRVSNTGTRAVDGQFTVTLTTPDGVQVLADRAVTLGFGGATAHSQVFTVTAATAAGTYTYAGSFTYSWTDDENVVHTGEILRSGSFVVRKIDVRVERDMPATASLGVPFKVVLTIENRGNEDAIGVSFAETVRDSYVLVPCAPDAFNSNWVHGGCPPANGVSTDSTFGRKTLTWEIGDLPAGSSVTIEYTAIATKTGTFPFIGVAKYKDGAGKAFLQGMTSAQVVTAAPQLV